MLWLPWETGNLRLPGVLPSLVAAGAQHVDAHDRTSDTLGRCG